MVSQSNRTPSDLRSRACHQASEIMICNSLIYRGEEELLQNAANHRVYSSVDDGVPKELPPPPLQQQRNYPSSSPFIVLLRCCHLLSFGPL